MSDGELFLMFFGCLLVGLLGFWFCSDFDGWVKATGYLKSAGFTLLGIVGLSFLLLKMVGCV